MKTQLKNSAFAILYFAFCAILFTSCKKDDAGTEKPTKEMFKAAQNTALADLLQDTTFNAEDGVVFISEKGAKLEIPSNALSYGGTQVTGSVLLQYTEIFDAGNMAATNKPTMGVLPGGKKSLLISGGEFNINVFKDGKLLDLDLPMTLTVPVNLTDSMPTDMSLFKGDIDEDGNLDWNLEEDKNVKVRDGNNPLTGAMELQYQALVADFGWTNIDRFYSDPRPKTTMQVSVPTGYDYGNCALYLHYDGEGSSLARLDTYDTSTKLFSEHYGQIPIGLACHLIFCSIENDQWKFAIKPITISDSTIYTITESEMTVASKKTYVGHVTLLK